MKKITFSIPWPLSAKETRELLSFAFQVGVITYLGFFLVENIRPSFVTMFYSLDTFLWAAVIAGVISGIWPAIVPAAKHSSRQPTWVDVIWMGVLAIGTGLVVWYKTSSIGWLAAVIAPISGLIVFGLSLLVYYDRDDDPEPTT